MVIIWPAAKPTSRKKFLFKSTWEHNPKTVLVPNRKAMFRHIAVRLFRLQKREIEKTKTPSWTFPEYVFFMLFNSLCAILCLKTIKNKKFKVHLGALVHICWKTTLVPVTIPSPTVSAALTTPAKIVCKPSTNIYLSYKPHKYSTFYLVLTYGGGNLRWPRYFLSFVSYDPALSTPCHALHGL